MNFLNNDTARLKANKYGSFLYNALERLLDSNKTEKDLRHAWYALNHVTSNIKRACEEKEHVEEDLQNFYNIKAILYMHGSGLPQPDVTPELLTVESHINKLEKEKAKWH